MVERVVRSDENWPILMYTQPLSLFDLVACYSHARVRVYGMVSSEQMQTVDVEVSSALRGFDILLTFLALSIPNASYSTMPF